VIDDAAGSPLAVMSIAAMSEVAAQLGEEPRRLAIVSPAEPLVRGEGLIVALP
jgi:hypothetical protein